MKKFLKSMDDMLYMNVTDKAQALFGIFDLFVLWEKGDTTYRLPVTSGDELRFALTQPEKFICIEIGNVPPARKLNWERADTITHNGYIYVKYNDLFE